MGSPSSTVMGPPPASMRAAIRRRLLRWYDRHKRDLPWRRRADDPYAQWVAEIMLQQTRVDTVIHYYERFLASFPSVDVLAGADHEQVLKRWEGLGYYRRCLQLHRAARLLQEDGSGIPETADALRTLPGIGEYTAAAIASIAYGQRVAAVDGNVARVVSRLFGVTDDILSTQGKARVREIATSLTPIKRPGDFNQAWMDLGSTVCTPRAPDCPRCPLASDCVARATGEAATLPIRNSRKRPTEVPFVVALFLRRGRMLVRRRAVGGLWSGLWEFPNVETPPGSGATQALGVLAAAEHVRMAGRSRRVAVVRRQLTHRSLTFHIYVCDVAGAPRTMREDRRWATPADFAELSVSGAHRRIFAAAQAHLEHRDSRGPSA